MDRRVRPGGDECGRRAKEIRMAAIERIQRSLLERVVPEADLKVYAMWRRETFVGPRPALLAIDLYDLVYRGGPRPPSEINDKHPNTCGIFAHRAIAPTKRLVCGRAPRRHPDLLLHAGDPAQQSAGRRGLDEAARDPRPSADGFAIYQGVSGRADRHRHHQAARQRLPGDAAVLAPDDPRCVRA